MPSPAVPYLLEFPRLGAPDIGYIAVGEQQRPPLPFVVQRAYWTYHTPESILRGRHAHRHTEQVLIAVAGRIIVTTELADGTLQTFLLKDPFVGLYVPPGCWHTMQYGQAAVQLVLASTPYNESDYIRDYAEFQRLWTAPQ